MGESVFDLMRTALLYEHPPTGDEIADEGINMTAWFAARDAALTDLSDALIAEGRES